MVEFNWRIKDNEGRIYTKKHLAFLRRNYQDGEIGNGDLLFQSDETKPWIEIKDLKALFQTFEKENVTDEGKLVNKRILDIRTYHIAFLLFIFITLAIIDIHLGVTGRLFPSSFEGVFNIRSRVIFITVSLLLLCVFLFLPLTLFYSSILTWTNKIKKYFLQQTKTRTDENLNLKTVEKLAKSLSSSLEKTSLLRAILDSALKSSQFLAGFLLLRDYQRNQMIYETGLKIDRTMFKKTEYSFEETPIKEIIRGKQSLWLEDIDKKEFNYFLRPEKFSSLNGVASLVLMPLIAGEELLGILGLYGGRQEFAQFRQAISLHSILKNQASLALGSAIQSELAILDRLTGLLNHEYFMKKLNEEVERSRRFQLVMSLLMIDLDHFKHINDTYGHQTGDEVLKSVAGILNETTRVVDFCGRYGGEEFALALIDTDIEGAKIKAEQLRKAVSEQSFVFDNNRIKLTISIGIGTWRWPDDKGSFFTNLIKKADTQLYRAKKEGRNRVCFAV